MVSEVMSNYPLLDRKVTTMLIFCNQLRNGGKRCLSVPQHPIQLIEMMIPVSVISVTKGNHAVNKRIVGFKGGQTKPVMCAWYSIWISIVSEIFWSIGIDYLAVMTSQLHLSIIIICFASKIWNFSRLKIIFSMIPA